MVSQDTTAYRLRAAELRGSFQGFEAEEVHIPGHIGGRFVVEF